VAGHRRPVELTHFFDTKESGTGFYGFSFAVFGV